MISKKRNIRSGHEYDRYFAKSIGVDTVIKKDAKLHHTLNLMKEMIWETLDDTARIAPLLKGRDLRETCRNVWQWVYDHIQYKPDKRFIEQVRRAIRIWADRKTGCDCDCMSMMVVGILLNLDIKCELSVTAYLNKREPFAPLRYSHIYPIVPTPDGGYITMDCVTDRFDFEVPFAKCLRFEVLDRKKILPIAPISMEVSGVDTFALHEIIEVSDEADRPGKGKAVPGTVERNYFMPSVSVSTDYSKHSPVFNQNVFMRENRDGTGYQDLVSVHDRLIRDIEAIRAKVGNAVNRTIKPDHRKGLPLGKLLLASAIGYGTYLTVRFLTEQNTKDNGTSQT